MHYALMYCLCIVCVGTWPAVGKLSDVAVCDLDILLNQGIMRSVLYVLIVGHLITEGRSTFHRNLDIQGTFTTLTVHETFTK